LATSSSFCQATVLPSRVRSASRLASVSSRPMLLMINFPSRWSISCCQILVVFSSPINFSGLPLIPSPANIDDVALCNVTLTFGNDRHPSVDSMQPLIQLSTGFQIACGDPPWSHTNIQILRLTCGAASPTPPCRCMIFHISVTSVALSLADPAGAGTHFCSRIGLGYIINDVEIATTNLLQTIYLL